MTMSRCNSPIRSTRSMASRSSSRTLECSRPCHSLRPHSSRRGLAPQTRHLASVPRGALSRDAVTFGSESLSRGATRGWSPRRARVPARPALGCVCGHRQPNRFFPLFASPRGRHRCHAKLRRPSPLRRTGPRGPGAVGSRRAPRCPQDLIFPSMLTGFWGRLWRFFNFSVPAVVLPPAPPSACCQRRAAGRSRRASSRSSILRLRPRQRPGGASAPSRTSSCTHATERDPAERDRIGLTRPVACRAPRATALGALPAGFGLWGFDRASP